MKCILVQLMDPLVEWRNKELYLIDSVLTITSILTMRPGCWLSCSIIQEMIRWMNAVKVNPKIFFVHPEFIHSLEGQNSSHRMRVIFYEDMLLYDTILFVAHVFGCHYVELEIETPKRPTQTINFKYVDSFKNKKIK